MIQRIVSLLEDRLRIRIYRNSLPRGTDFAADINKTIGAANVSVIFDVGANIGQTAVDYSHRFPNATIYSFEPVKASFDTLSKAVANCKRVRPIRLAMGEQDGVIPISADGTSSCNSIVKPRGDVNELVPMSSVDRFMKRESLQGVDILKIDVEGFESQVLTGATQALQQQKIGFVYLESEPLETDEHFVPVQRLNERMMDFGYKFFGVYDQQPHWDGRRDLYFFNVVYISPKLISPGNFVAR